MKSHKDELLLVSMKINFHNNNTQAIGIMAKLIPRLSSLTKTCYEKPEFLVVPDLIPVVQEKKF